MADTNSTTKFTADISQLRAEMQAASRLVRVANSEFKAATAGMDDWSSSADGLQAKLKQLNTVLESQKKQVGLAEKELEEVTKEYGENSAEADRARIKLNNLTAEVAKTEKQQESYEQQLDDVTNATKDMGEATKEAESGFTIMKGVLADLASTAIQAGIEALKDFAQYSIQAGSDFEAGMSKVQATSGANANEIAALTEKAREMGSTTKFSATESAEAFNYMAMAGWDTQQMLDGIEGVMSLAAASGTDLAKTSDIVTDALTAMGYGAEDAGHFADVMASASSNANTNVEMMGETFQYVAPIAGAMGYSIEDTATAIGLMANAGIKGTKAGTSLRSIMSRLAAPPKDAADAMDALRISITTTTEDGEEVMLPFQDVVEQLRTKFSGLSEAEQTQAAKAIAGQEAMSGLLAIVNASDEDFEKLTTAINNSEGAAEAMATTMQDNLQGKITELSSAAEGLGIALYDQVKGPLSDAVETATGLIHGITDAITPQKTELEKFIEDIEASNAETRQSIENANSALANGAAKIQKIDSLAETIKGINEQFGIFAETDTSGVVTDTAETAEGVGTSMDSISSSAGGAKDSLSGIDDVTFDQVGENLGTAEGSIKTSTDAISTDLGTVSTAVQGLNGEQVNMSGLTGELTTVSAATREASGEMDEFTKAKVRYAIQELSKDIPALSDAWDDVTGTLKITYQEFNNVIDAQKRAIMESSLAKASADAMDVVVKAELEHQQAADALAAALKDAGDAAGKTFGSVQEVWDEIEGGSSWSSAVTYDMAKAATAANDAYEQTNETLAEAYETQGRVEEAAKKLAKQWGFTTEAAEQSAEATGNAVEKTEEQVAAEHAAAEAAYEAQKKIAQAHKDAAAEITDAYDQAKTAAESALSINPFEIWETDAEKGMSALQESLDSQVAGLTNYAANLEVVSEHVGKEISPEFLNYLEDMGAAGAQVVAELANAFASGDTESVDRLMKAYVDAMDIQDDLTSKIALDNLALQAGLGELSSTAEEWAGLDSAIEYIKGFGSEVSDEILEAFIEAKEAAQEAGIKIPEGLAEGIEKGSDDPNAALVDATQMLLEAITGQGEGLIHAAETAGISIPESIKSGILAGGDSAVTAYQSLLDLIGASSTDAAERGGEEAGKTFASSTASGVEEKQGEVEASATMVADSAQEAALEAGAKFAEAGSEAGESFGEGIESKRTDAAEDAEDLALYAALQAKSDEFEDKGEEAGQDFADGINAMTNTAYYAGRNIAFSADSGMASVSTYSTGTYFAQGFINGIADMVSSAAATATNLATSAADSIDAALLIGSPSKLTFETGRYFVQGFINGVASLTKGVIDTVKDLAGEAAKALVTDPGTKALISGDSIDYMIRRLTYESDVKANEFSSEIDALSKQRDAEVQEFKNAGDARIKEVQQAIEEEQARTTAAQKKIREDAEASLETAKTTYQTNQNTEKSRTAAVQKQIQEDADKALEKAKEDYEAAVALKKSSDILVKEIENEIDDPEGFSSSGMLFETEEDWLKYQKARLKEAKKGAKYSLEDLKKDYQKQVKEIQKAEKESLEAEKAASSETLAAYKAEYDEQAKAIRKTQEDQLEAEKTRTKNYQALLREQIDGINKTVSDETKKIQDEYAALIDAQTQNQAAYRTAASQMLSELSAAMSDYQRKAESLVNDTINGITANYDARVNDLTQQQDKIASKLESIGKLYDISGAGVMTISDLQEQTRNIKEYADKLRKIREQVSDSLFREISSLDTKEGSAYMDRLLDMSKEDLAAYDEAYLEMKSAAYGSAEDLYKDDFAEAADEYQASLENAFRILPDKLKELGEQALQGFITGLTKNTDYMDESVKTFVQALITEFKDLLKIASPSKVMERLGEFTGEGFGDGLRAMLDDVKAIAGEISSVVQTPIEGIGGSLQGAWGNPYGAGGPAGQVVNNYNLVQNNNSPKALSALDTFQARRRQIAMIKQFA